MEDYLIGIGKRLKEIRKSSNRTMPSLPVLLKLINSLEIEVTDFFMGMPQSNGANFIVSRKEENAIIEKEDEAIGFTYKYIFGKQVSSLGFETVLLEVAPNSEREKVTTDAYEFKCFYFERMSFNSKRASKT